MQYLLAITLFALPLYAWPFRILGVSTNLLMLWLGVLWLIFFAWLVSKRRVAFFIHWFKDEFSTYYLLLTTLFFVAGLISVFVGGISIEKLGQFIVLFVQPIGTFFIARYIFKQFPNSSTVFLKAAYAFVFVAGVFAIIQYTTKFGLSMLYWGNDFEPKRALSFFMHPNFYAMFVTPLLAFLIPDLVSKISARGGSASGGKDYRFKIKVLVPAVAWVTGTIGLLLSLSRGGWLGFAASVGVYVVLSANKWLSWHVLIIAIAAINIAWAIPQVRSRIIAPFAGERSANSRFALWRTGEGMIQDGPVFGKGILGFGKNYEAYKVDSTLDSHPTPHNVFLHAWVEYGLLGLLSFLTILVYGLWNGLKNKKTPLLFGVGLALVALVVHGVVDTSIFKNDLAVLFWLLLAFL